MVRALLNKYLHTFFTNEHKIIKCITIIITLSDIYTRQTFKLFFFNGITCVFKQNWPSYVPTGPNTTYSGLVTSRPGQTRVTANPCILKSYGVKVPVFSVFTGGHAGQGGSARVRRRGAVPVHIGTPVLLRRTAVVICRSVTRNNCD